MPAGNDPPVADRIRQVRKRIGAAARRAGRDPNDIRLVAVSKTVPADLIRPAAAAGLTEFGENRVQEARDKIQVLPPDLTWHLVGSLQRNKARLAAGLFGMIESVDRLSLAKTLDDVARRRPEPLPVLVQVNIGGEAQKSGVSPQDLPDLLRRMAGLEAIRVRGLMAIPPWQDDPEASRPYFRALRELADGMRSLEIPGLSMDELSMGMSADFEVAIEEGATIVRVGTAIFGSRPKP
jgi:pyridoxal phosphate enzyme (YggS family)